MTLSLLQEPVMSFEDGSGRPLSGGKLHTYAAGTLTLKATFQDQAGTIPNTNPITLNARGEATVYGSGNYRMILKDRNGVTIWDRDNVNAQDLSQGGGSSLIGFIQGGAGAVSRTAQDKMRDIVSANDFGPAGDGSTDDTVAIQNAFNAAQNKTLLLGENKVYAISQLTIPDNVTLIACGSSFKKVVVGPTPGITVGKRFKADQLRLVTTGGPTDAGVAIDGDDSEIGAIYIESVAADSGAEDSDYVGLLVGPSAGAAVGTVIHKTTVKNYCRPMRTRNVRQGVFNRTTFENYRRGLYVQDCQDSVWFMGKASGLSPSSAGGPGDNAVLIESTIADGSSQNLHFYGWRAEDSGEHGFRLGGQLPIRNVWFNDCSSIRPGAAATATGGCGFKAQGSSNTSYHYNVNLTNFVCEDGKPGGGNFCGIFYGLVDGGQVSSPIIRNRQNSSSTWHGISFISCRNIFVDNPTVRNAGQYALRFYTAAAAGFTDGIYDVVVNGGLLENAPSANAPVIQFDGNDPSQPIDAPIVRCGVRDVIVRGGAQAVRATGVTGSGAYTNCFLDFTYLDSIGAGATSTGTDPFLSNIVVNTVNFFTPAAIGSTQRVRGGRIYIKDAGGWGSVTTSFTVTLNDDTAFSWTPPNTSQHIFVTMPAVSYYGQAWVRSTASPSAVKVSGAANFAALPSALNGTTGVDGNVTIGAQNNTLYLENRSGSTQTITVTQLG